MAEVSTLITSDPSLNHPLEHWSEEAEAFFKAGEQIMGEGIMIEIETIQPNEHSIVAIVLGVNRHSKAINFYSGQRLTFIRSLRGDTWRADDSEHPTCFIRLTSAETKVFEYVQ